MSTIPFTIVDNTASTARQLGLYVQDAWQPGDSLMVSFGVRWDKVDSFVSQSQWSPRIGAVWKATPSTTLHAGYSRYFTPPPSELITDVTLEKFVGTTNQQPGTENSPVKSGSSNYYDAGMTQRVTNALSLGVDGYYRQMTNLLDEGQFRSALLFTPFNYAKGRVYGIEISSSYKEGNFSAYANLAYSKAHGENIVSSQYNFAPDELDYIPTTSSISHMIKRGRGRPARRMCGARLRSALRRSTAADCAAGPPTRITCLSTGR
jgi:outer membrane receptor protein involved in Fe transport